MNYSMLNIINSKRINTGWNDCSLKIYMYTFDIDERPNIKVNLMIPFWYHLKQPLKECTHRYLSGPYYDKQDISLSLPFFSPFALMVSHVHHRLIVGGEDSNQLLLAAGLIWIRSI
jgi:hypothetical protein